MHNRDDDESTHAHERNGDERRRPFAMPKEHIWRWVGTAPLPVVLSVCLFTSGLLAAWVWDVQAEVHQQQTISAVATAEATAAKNVALTAESRLVRMETKLDMLLDEVATLRATSTQPSRPRRVDKE